MKAGRFSVGRLASRLWLARKLRLVGVRRVLTLLLLPCWLAVLMQAAAGQTAARPPHDDVQEWNDVQLTIPIEKRTSFILSGSLRLGDAASRLVDERGGAGLNFKANKFLSISPGWLYIATQPVPGRHAYENRLVLAVTGNLPLGQYLISDRNQAERRLLSGRPDTTRYRNRLQVERPVVIRDFALRLFASAEIYYDHSVHAWLRKEYNVGVARNFTEHLSAEVNYRRRNDHYSHPGDMHIVVTTLKIRL